ncbi:MAG: rhomboid family intramembrane serine protease [Oscillospiraceae bacterium]|nr:rhomboid family intramembrane serine protease [Oscillospiraceae bacterium]
MSERIRIHYNAPVVLTVFLLSLAALILGTITSGWTTQHLFSVYRSSPLNPLFYLRLFTHILGHSGYEHFVGNMVLLLVVGPPMEEKYGSGTLLIGILLTAVISGLLQCLLFPNTALLGASGVVFMLIMLSSLAGMKTGSIPLTLILVAILYLGQEIYSALFVQDNVAHFMHLVGGTTGTVFGFTVARKRL